MRLRTYLVLLALVCGLGGLLLEFVIFQRQHELDRTAAIVEAARERHQDINRLADHISQLLISLDLLFGASETYMINATHKQLELASNLTQGLTRSAADYDDTVAYLKMIGRHLDDLKQQVDRVSVRAGEAEFFVADNQLDQFDKTTLALTGDLQRLIAVGTQMADRARSHQATLRDSFDTVSWLAGAVYIFVVGLILVWTTRSVARPLNRVAAAADIALRDHRPFAAPIDGPEEVKRLAEHISTLVHSLERAVDSRTQFLASMSHELRTPLNGILGMTALLLDSDLRSQDRRCMELIRSSGESLLAIINELLDFARYEDGSIELELDTFSLEQLVSEVLDVTTPLAHQRGIALYLDMPLLDVDSYVGDKNRLRQVLLNLLSNAIKFTHKGSVTLSIGATEISDGQSEVQFCVKDTGIGIPSDKLEAIFDPFSQSDASITRKYGGTGLGLAICAEIVGLMGSEISVHSKIDVGSEFAFTIDVAVVVDEGTSRGVQYPQQIGLVLFDEVKRRHVKNVLQQAGIDIRYFESIHALDLARVTAHVLIEVTDSNAAAINKFATANPNTWVLAMGYSGLLLNIDEAYVDAVADPACPRELLNALASDHPQAIDPDERSNIDLRVLLVDDNPVNLNVATKMIERLGCLVDRATNGQEAIEACARDSYDVVFMDVHMPFVDGLTATRTIRARHAQQPVIVAMTANAMEEDRAACFDAGMDEFLTKPIRISEIDTLLNKIGQKILHKSA